MDEIQNNVIKEWIFMSGKEDYFGQQAPPRCSEDVVSHASNVWKLPTKRFGHGERRAGHSLSLALQCPLYCSVLGSKGQMSGRAWNHLA